MPDLLTSAPDLDTHVDTNRLTMWLRPGLAVSRIEGHFSSEVASLFVATAEPIIRQSESFVGLHDWSDAVSFDAMVPPRLAAWTIGLLPRIGRIVIATQHPLVSMAVRTTNLTIKRIEHLGSRDEWTEVVRRAT